MPKNTAYLLWPGSILDCQSRVPRANHLATVFPTNSTESCCHELHKHLARLKANPDVISDGFDVLAYWVKINNNYCVSTFLMPDIKSCNSIPSLLIVLSKLSCKLLSNDCYCPFMTKIVGLPASCTLNADIKFS